MVPGGGDGREQLVRGDAGRVELDRRLLRREVDRRLDAREPVQLALDAARARRAVHPVDRQPEARRMRGGGHDPMIPPRGIIPGLMAATERTPRGYSADRPALLNRLRRIEGQARGLTRMVEEERYCIDVLTQIAAVRSALDGVSLGLLDAHVRHCVANGDPALLDERADELARTLAPARPHAGRLGHREPRRAPARRRGAGGARAPDGGRRALLHRRDRGDQRGEADARRRRARARRRPRPLVPELAGRG